MFTHFPLPLIGLTAGIAAIICLLVCCASENPKVRFTAIILAALLTLVVVAVSGSPFRI